MCVGEGRRESSAGSVAPLFPLGCLALWSNGLCGKGGKTMKQATIEGILRAYGEGRLTYNEAQALLEMLQENTDTCGH